MTDEPERGSVSFDKQSGAAASGSGPSYPGAPPTGYPPGAYGPSAYGAPGYGPPAPGPAHGPGGYAGYPPHPGYGYPPPGPKPSSNIGWAIASVILFWPLCIPAFMASARVDGAWFAGDYFGAQKASNDAKKFGMIGVIVGASLIALYFLFIVIVFGIVIGTASHVHPVSPAYLS